MNIVYVCDIGQDVDDVIAVEYLHINGHLDCVVLDGTNTEGETRINSLLEMGVIFKDSIPSYADTVFCGGALTKVAEFLESESLDLLVCNGGFAGSNIVLPENQLVKFSGVESVRTYNFNLDVESAKLVMNSEKINEVLLVSKNVCHHQRNTYGQIHNDSFIKKYGLSPKKRLHDLLMVKEGIGWMNADSPQCKYREVKCTHSFDVFDLWGSVPSNNSNIKISVSLN